MTVRVGINGFGRIGRNYLRAVLSQGADIEIVAVNDLTDAQVLANLTEWDSLLGRLDATVEVGDGELVIDGRPIKVLAERNPADLPWGELGVDVVIESTGRFTSADAARAHLDAGAKKVIISAPGSGDVKTIVLGINDDTYDAAEHDIVSNGSCTTNSLAFLGKVLHEEFGVETGLMTTVHAYTGDQRLQDAPHGDARRARAAALSIIPTSSGAAKAIGLVVPELEGKLTGLALRVPVPVGSVTDLTADLEREVTAEEVNEAFERAAASERYGRYLEYSEDPLVSVDITGNPHSTIFDSGLTRATGRQVKVFGWYDNEWGFSNRLVELSLMVLGR
ncbi:type I glyceraldehyde-3-phosphate dehydrogenase [Gulosibacter sp. 10]|uniref:type I glyceraldehyde-3-phosphate dehydrogenase n=1 Tax=Gulosibacter sp. 10 TaxID=1255570 RepID=UPI00097EBCD7|nr:type I glyceraldehyde-3-phosphate dehydrogenase [Gulosibacter sp. 10]SJM55323.1 NAD-dependent glyceraldehyde-3-phosphate dehydrogenase [Gulosibacter sp. 10]